MLTLFAMPKPFEGHIEVIQRNAIRSWTLLVPRPQIVLLGSESGTAEVAHEFGLIHVPTVKCNKYSTPLVSDIFAKAEACSSEDLFCYVNSDIILTSDFMRAVMAINRSGQHFLMCGRRWDVAITENLTFDGEWEARLRDLVRLEGHLDPPGSVDYFVYPRKLWGDIPAFALGRFYWDSWLLYRARQLKVTLVDVTSCVMAVHQRHSYNQSSVQQGDPSQGPEAIINIDLAGGEHHLYTLRSATHLLKNDVLERSKFGPRQLEFLQSNWRFYKKQSYKALQGASVNRPLVRRILRPLMRAAGAFYPLLSRGGRALVRYRDRAGTIAAPISVSTEDSPAVLNEKE